MPLSTHSAVRALHRRWPSLQDHVPFCHLGELPTPVEKADQLVSNSSPGAFIKRDDLTSPVYGGNKVRTLEVLFADALANDASHIYSTGAHGSNHATATVLHAPRVGLQGGAILFPQPYSTTAAANLEVLLSDGAPMASLPHWSTLPFGLLLWRRRCEKQGQRPYIMVPGGATPLGALGYVSAALEVYEQVAKGELPAPDEIVLAVGSTCTTAGLLVGCVVGAMPLGLEPPQIVAVRVTPWPVTAPWRILGLARRTAELLSSLTGEPPVSSRQLSRLLTVETHYLGAGYGEPTPAGRAAMRRFRDDVNLQLDTTYSAKAAAAWLDRLARSRKGTSLFWATKSTAPLPPPVPDNVAQGPARMRKWLRG